MTGPNLAPSEAGFLTRMVHRARGTEQRLELRISSRFEPQPLLVGATFPALIDELRERVSAEPMTETEAPPVPPPVLPPLPAADPPPRPTADSKPATRAGTTPSPPRRVTAASPLSPPETDRQHVPSPAPVVLSTSRPAPAPADRSAKPTADHPAERSESGPRRPPQRRVPEPESNERPQPPPPERAETRPDHPPPEPTEQPTVQELVSEHLVPVLVARELIRPGEPVSMHLDDWQPTPVPADATVHLNIGRIEVVRPAPPAPVAARPPSPGPSEQLARYLARREAEWR
ncbi:hypothetical protein GCM10009678_72250 [Actinomadura kijaniata]|uniref:Uncharacterized protein n=1 Tax=Actinomadura namibiensis TaxID=182080 RepID=A0A7W3QRD9_ACTNM|nr:hypothetical protein [Actinomadura namibiensis]